MGFKNALQCSRALWHIYKTVPEVQKEWAGVKMLWHHTSPPLRIGTTKKPVKTLADLKGLKIWVTGTTAVKAGKALGCSPVTMPPGDVYLALQKGVIDGAMADNEITVSRKFDEVIKYFTDIDMAQVNFALIMNQNVWDGLPADVKKVFDELSGEYMVEFTGKIRDEKEQEAIDVIKGKGVQYLPLPPAEKEKARKLMEPVKSEYAGELDKKGLPGTKVLREVEKFAMQ
ncbi:MAG: TRAP transporter substrate-binding protein DctP [Pseudomonadota bacterium]